MSLFEALNWADAIDHFLAHGPEERGGKPDWLDGLSEIEREVARAVQHARNVVHHQWWEALDTQIVVDENGQVDTWLRGELPANNRNKDGQEPYDSAVRGKSVAETLEVLRDAFWPMRHWQITREDLDQPGYPLPACALVDS